MLIQGKCHCGNISFSLTWEPDPAEIPARACGCSFCTKHGGVWTSNPGGALEVRVKDPSLVSRYAFGTRTADFHTCARCGIVPVVTSRIEGRLYAVVSVNAFEGVDPSLVRRVPASFDGEGNDARLARRQRSWIANVKYLEVTEDSGSTQAEAKMFTMGAGYERFMGRWSRLLAPAYIAFAGIKDGDRVLDIGTGTGSVASTLGAAMPSSEVVGIDPSEAFISYAGKNAKSGRARFEVGDAQALRFEDASFDHTMALLVMNFVPDHGKAIGEMRRVTRPGGAVSACVWDYNAGMEMLRFFWDEVVALDPAMAPKDERHMKLSLEGQLGALWKSAGLANIREKPLTIEQAYTSFDDYWGPFLKGAGPGGAYVVSLTEERRRQLEARMRKRLLGNRDDGAFTLTARAWCVRGEVPTKR